MEEKQNAVLGTAPLGRLMMKFALPCTVSLLVGALYNIVDQIFIGWGVGYLGNGATNVVFPLTVLALGLAVMIGDGACSYVSICFGKNQPENANRAVGSAVALSVLVGIAVAVLYAVFQMPLLSLFGATEANLSYAKEYFTYITIGVPIYVFGQAINPIIRSDGSPQFAMLSMCRRDCKLHSGPDCNLRSALGRDGRGCRNGGRAGHHGGNGRMVPVPHKGTAPESGRF